MGECEFTYNHLRKIYETAFKEGYDVITLHDYFSGNFKNGKPIIINRIDIDARIDRIPIFLKLYSDLGVKATFFPRIHSKDYNLFTFSWFNLIKELIYQGHEIGVHSEIIDMCVICSEEPCHLVQVEKKMMEGYFNIKIFGFASHSDFTKNNNLDFWNKHKPSEFGLEYEAYDTALWNNCRYISDSEVIRWKSYENGKLKTNDNRCPCIHFTEHPPIVYLLIHPDSFYENHYHELYASCKI